MPTFAQSYCARHRLSDDHFAPAVLREALHPQARILSPFIAVAAPDFFAADLELISALGRVRSVQHFREVSAVYRHRLARAGFARRTLRLRVSLRRLRDVMAETFDARTHAALIAAEQRSG